MELIINETEDGTNVVPVAQAVETILVEGAANFAPAGPPGPPGPAGENGASRGSPFIGAKVAGWYPLALPSTGTTVSNNSWAVNRMYARAVYINTWADLPFEVTSFSIEVTAAGTATSNVRWALYRATSDGDINWASKVVEVNFPTGASTGVIQVAQSAIIEPGLYWHAYSSQNTAGSLIPALRSPVVHRESAYSILPRPNASLGVLNSLVGIWLSNNISGELPNAAPGGWSIANEASEINVGMYITGSVQ